MGSGPLDWSEGAGLDNPRSETSRTSPVCRSPGLAESSDLSDMMGTIVPPKVFRKRCEYLVRGLYEMPHFKNPPSPPFIAYSHVFLQPQLAL